jgi:hypothetical protein
MNFAVRLPKRMLDGHAFAGGSKISRGRQGINRDRPPDSVI